MTLPSNLARQNLESSAAASAPTPAQVLPLWVIWGAILSGVFVLQFTSGKGLPTGANGARAGIDPFVVIALGALLVATAIRWWWLPRSRNLGQRLVAMIIGLALSESAVIFEILLMARDQPAMRLAIFGLGVLSVLQFVPIYAAKPFAGKTDAAAR